MAWSSSNHAEFQHSIQLLDTRCLVRGRLSDQPSRTQYRSQYRSCIRTQIGVWPEAGNWDFVFHCSYALVGYKLQQSFSIERHASEVSSLSEISARRGHYVARCRMPVSMTPTLKSDPLELAASRCYRIQSMSGWRHRIYPFRGIRNIDKFIRKKTHERSTNEDVPNLQIVRRQVSSCQKNPEYQFYYFR